MTRGWSERVRPLDSERIFRELAAQEVRYVLVGGVAAILHRWSGSTFDLDLVPADDTANLNGLGGALRALEAVVYATPSRKDLLADGEPPEADDFGYTAEGLRRARTWHLTSEAGLIDVSFEIDGVGGYPRLEANAEARTVFDLTVRVASLGDIIASKRAVARPKDLRVLPELEELAIEPKTES